MHTVYVPPSQTRHPIPRTGIAEERDLFEGRLANARRFSRKRRLVQWGLHKLRAKSLLRFARKHAKRGTPEITAAPDTCPRPSPSHIAYGHPVGKRLPFVPSR